MSKMSNLCLLLNEIIEHGEAILEAAKEIRDMFSEEPAALPEKKAATPKKAEKKGTEPALSFTDLRAKLADKSRAGYTAEIKKILHNHKADKLSDISPADYETVLKEVEALTHE